MRIVFAATPALALPVFESLLHMPSAEIVGIVTQPDRKAGRGMRLVPSPVKKAALDAGIEVIAPGSLRENKDALVWLRSRKPDVLVVVAFGVLLPKSWLDAPRHGAVNVHASLLPRWRGAAPIERAILAGDLETGVCIMHMDEGLDTGRIYAEARVPIGAETTAGELRENLMSEGAALLVITLPGIVDGSLACQPQSRDGVTYASKLSACDRDIDWSQNAQQIDRCVRAFAPVPGARSQLTGKWLKVLSGKPFGMKHKLQPGEVSLKSGNLDVGCGQGMFRILRLQPEGKKPMDTADFLRGWPGVAGVRLGH